jgi:hypothetical protein
MRLPTLVCVALAILTGCAGKQPAPPAPGAETVRVATGHPGASFVELGPVTGIDGIGCGDSGKRGNFDSAVSSLMKNAFTMGGTHVQVLAVYEPRKMGDCFVNIYRISGTAYRDAKAAPAPVGAAKQQPSGDVVQQLRDLQKLREEKVITDQEFERLKTRMIGGG